MKQSLDMEDFLYEAQKIEGISTIFEIGALDGADSVLFKSRIPNAEVYAIEGLPDNFENKLSLQTAPIHKIQRVISNYDGSIIYFHKDYPDIGGIFDRGQAYGTKQLTLSCSRIDSLCREIGINSIDMVKIDVEGASYEALEGFGDMLKTVKIMHIETEMYPFFTGQKLHDDVCGLLNSNGFNMIRFEKCEIVPGQFQCDSIWTK